MLKPGKFLPHAIMIPRTDTTSNAQRIGFLYNTKPISASMQIMAPEYTGPPAVDSGSPQNLGRLVASPIASASGTPLALSLLTTADFSSSWYFLEPPYALGIS